MADIDHPGIPDSRRDEAVKIARLQAEGKKCPYYSLQVDLTLSTPVSPETRAFCEKELADAKKRGYRLLSSQKNPKASKKEPEPDVEVGPDDRA
jgi:hypothetical protein